MSVLPHSVEKVINEFSKLPGVGPKSAARMTYHYLRSPNKDASKLGEALIQMDENTKFCSKCFNVTDLEICNICSSSLRDSSKICIVEEPLDVVAFENSGVFNGVYFVLGGVISPADGIGASELRFDELQKRIKELMEESEKKVEVIVATNPSLEGEATASYILDMFNSEVKDSKIQITRLAMGLPTGADLEYADRLTLKKALEGRRDI
ncbi:MAG: recombination protein RecR, recombination protein RecR [candidate division WS6 bacterium GW2011_GWC1_33_20]|uniref:Recombination protein RecR n=1 Tax=candidate division WS6 bacterium GW2011_GWC1_33_20 TaxID=1619089 RepID=A0A0G0C0J3_9BACT|nr:MAG: recombination protein RecR, recombination protein RecR [candidate division WS6 bacterium GW2011_GWC1_33_20]HBB64650.1 recombination protein RecR [Patescibacteria group bacterium]